MFKKCIFSVNVIFAAVNHMNPTKAYKKFELILLEGLKLPADQPEFIALLEERDIISEKTKKKLHMPKETEGNRAVSILRDIQESDKKFHDFLAVMIDYKHGLETLAQKIKSHLDPSMYEHMCLYMHKLYVIIILSVCMHICSY